jgi:hypothetical protein
MFQIAEKTNDVARSTLVELHRQGQQLERADLGMKQVGGGASAAELRDSLRCGGGEAV